MKISLIKNWKRVALRGYSPWLIMLAAIFSGLEIALPFIPIPMHSGTFAGISLAVSTIAYIARFIAQKELHDENEHELVDDPVSS